MRKFWFVLAGILLLSGAGFGIWFYFKQAPHQPQIASYQRQKLSKFKGIWPAPGNEDFLINSLSEIKELGVNIVPVAVSFCVKGTEIEPIVYGPPWQKFQQEKIVKQRIEKIHQAG
ncbi:hypothetical protein J7L09_02270, partial [bacterium]|nr:hypothetical protein [bacterium]